MRLPFTVRQSLLEQARCLHRLHETQLRHIAEPESEFARRGTDFHELARRYVDYLVASQQPMDWSYAHDLTASGEWNEEAAWIFKRWAEHSFFDPSKIFATEYKIRLTADFESCDEGDPRCVYSGDLDRVDINGLEATITDYKSFWQIKEPQTIQAIFYPWLLFKVVPNLERAVFVLDFVRYPGSTRRREFTRDHLVQMDAYVRNQVARLAEAYATDEWPATVNAGCTFCRLNCPLVEAGLAAESVGQVRSIEQARAMAGQMFALRRAYGNLHAALKSYANLNGTIDVGNDVQLGFSKQDQFEYDVRTVQALNDEHGFAHNRTLGVSSREIVKIGRTYPEYLTRARATAREKGKTVFKFTSVHGDPLEQEEDEGFD